MERLRDAPSHQPPNKEETSSNRPTFKKNINELSFKKFGRDVLGKHLTVSMTPFNLHEAKRRSWIAFVKKEKEKQKKSTKYLAKMLEDDSEHEAIERDMASHIEQKYRSFKRFFFCNDGTNIANELLTVVLFYITSLITLEKYKTAESMLSRNQYREVYRVVYQVLPKPGEVLDTTKLKKQLTQHLNVQCEESHQHLTSLSFIYSKLLSKYRFRNDHLREKEFFETFYFVVNHFVLNRFENQFLHPIIENELNRLFRSEHFFMTRDQHRDMAYFISTRDMYNLKHHSNVKLPLTQIKSKISTATDTSPLLKSILPYTQHRPKVYMPTKNKYRARQQKRMKLGVDPSQHALKFEADHLLQSKQLKQKKKVAATTTTSQFEEIEAEAIQTGADSHPIMSKILDFMRQDDSISRSLNLRFTSTKY